jgi:hypothetical protein
MVTFRGNFSFASKQGTQHQHSKILIFSPFVSTHASNIVSIRFSHKIGMTDAIFQTSS